MYPDKKLRLELEDGTMSVDTHTFDADALVIEDEQIRKVMLMTRDRKPWLSMSFEAPVLGLWPPPSKNAPFICIERQSRFSGELKDKDHICIPCTARDILFIY